MKCVEMDVQGRSLIVSLLPRNPPGSQIQYCLSMIWPSGNPLGFQIQYAGTKVS